LRSTVALVFLAACGGRAPPPAVVSPDPFVKALAEARAKRDDAQLTLPPTPPRPNPKPQALHFIKTQVKPWYESTRPKVQDAEAAYATAYRTASTPEERELALAEAIDLDATFAQRFADAGAQSIPDEWHVDTRLRSTFDAAMYESVRPWIARARDLVKKCAADVPQSKRCAQAETRVAALESRAAAVVASVPETKPSTTCQCKPADPLCSCL
jgi:hypothetical protein